jgi:outer membrane immunogenic protein
MNSRLISTFCACVFIVAASGAAFAADLARKMPVKAPPPPPPAPVYTWTGWYVGGNVGYSWGNANTDLRGNGTVTSVPPLTTIPPFIAPFAFTDSNTARLKGVIGGGQLGYNYQFSPNWVLGFEADIQGSGERGSGVFTDPFSFLFCSTFSSSGCIGGTLFPINGTELTSYRAKIDWFGTVRGRLGVLLADQVLLYATGGLAYGRVAISGNTMGSSTIAQTVPVTIAGSTPFSGSKTNVGFSVGGGMEGRFSYWLPPNWTWKLEYLYLDLGSLDATTPFVQLSSNLAVVSNLTGTTSTHTHFTDNIVRVGLNYQFH